MYVGVDLYNIMWEDIVMSEKSKTVNNILEEFEGSGLNAILALHLDYASEINDIYLEWPVNSPLNSSSDVYIVDDYLRIELLIPIESLVFETLLERFTDNIQDALGRRTLKVVAKDYKHTGKTNQMISIVVGYGGESRTVEIDLCRSGYLGSLINTDGVF